ncbi:MAG: cardiolipin synthase, partial [Gammaproteobacteria bacterium]
LLTVPSVLLQKAGRPAAALSWLLALFALPALALVAWWLFGRTHLRRKKWHRRRASRLTAESLSRTRRRMLQTAQQGTALEQTVSRLAPAMPSELHDTIFPPTSGNRVELLSNTAQAHKAWLRLVDGASRHLHLLFYIWRDDSIGRLLRDRLTEKAAQGVEVRVLYDAVGSHALPGKFFAPLVAAGGQATEFMPLRLASAAPTLNFRNHRKLIIADAWRAYTGSINVGDEYLGWQDIGVCIHGPGVNQLQEVFVDDWHFTTAEGLAGEEYFCEYPPGREMPGQAVCETIASGPEQAFNTTREMVFLAITGCRHRLWIATPYFVPEPALLLALRTAVYRGVDVRLILPQSSDAWLVRRASRVFYPELIRGGIKVFEYRGMLHAKTMLLDDDAALIGSANLDVRSFRLNFELSTFVTDVGLNRNIATLLEGLQAHAVQVDQDELRGAQLVSRLQDALAHLLSPLL